MSRDYTATPSDSTSNSMGNVASNSYTKENDVACVVTLEVVRYVHNAAVNLTSQSLLESIIVLRRMLNRISLITLRLTIGLRMIWNFFLWSILNLVVKS